MAERQLSDLALWLRLMRQARRYWAHVLAVMALSLLGTPLLLLQPVPFKIVVDSVIGSKPIAGFMDLLVPAAARESETRLLVFAVAMMLGIVLVQQVRGGGAGLLRLYTAQRLVLDLRTRLFRHLQRLSVSYHDRLGSGRAAYRVQFDTTAVQQLVFGTAVPMVSAVVTVVAMLYATLRLNPPLVGVALLAVPVVLLISRAYRGPLRRGSRKARALQAEAFAVVPEALSASRVVKSFGAEEREAARFMRSAHRSFRAGLRLSLSRSMFGMLVGLTTAVATAAVLYVGVHQVLNGAITLGELILVTAYIRSLRGPMTQLSTIVANVQSQLASADRIFSVLDELPEVPERPNARSLVRARGDVELRDVSFEYEPGAPLLRDASLVVPAGTRVGIAGATGSGKTTLLNLLLRFYDPVSGAILLDGVDIRDYKLADLRRQFATVLQESVLFHTTIAENIAYANPDADDDEIVAAAKAAGAHAFIEELDDGYETVVGERGMRLSGGERQRVAIARAFLCDGPVLLLDEPTSSLDAGTEAAIFEAMNRLMQGRTTFLVAHRVHTLKDCDLLLRLEDGRFRRTDYRELLQEADAPSQAVQI